MHIKVEYIWLDGYEPEPNLRSKTKIIENKQRNLSTNEPITELLLSDIPEWSFDGSSTKQAEGNSSDCILNPVKLYNDPFRKNSYLVMCEVLDPENNPHKSNTRSVIKDNSDQFWFGMEQEYTLMKNGRPYGFPENGYPNPQGMYYCGVGYGNVTGREIVEEHLDACLEAGLNITGVNHEVMLGQSEYQLLSKGAKNAGDDLWISRYILYRIAEKYKLKVDLHPKPMDGDWNGSGCHFNFSNTMIREVGGKDYINQVCDAFGERHDETIAEYGSSNEMRLTGKHETQSIDKFSYGVSDRGASIRIPISVPRNDWKGYLEDRRPASNCDPYKVTNMITDIVNSVNVNVDAVESIEGDLPF